jgi:hypothetical protein
MTPHVHAVPDDDAGKTNNSDLLQDHGAQPAVVLTPSLMHKTANHKPFISIHLWQDMADAIRA